MRYSPILQRRRRPLTVTVSQCRLRSRQGTEQWGLLKRSFLLGRVFGIFDRIIRRHYYVNEGQNGE